MKNIILTGASDGLGKEFAKWCISKGYNIIAICRTKPDYKCDFISMDLTNEKSMLNDCNIIKEKYNEFEDFINCAGVTGIKELDKITYRCL